MEGGQAVLKDGGGLSHSHDFLIDLIGTQELDALLPQLCRLAHGEPYIGVEHIAVTCADSDIVGELKHRAGLGGDCLALLNEPILRHELLGATGAEVHAELCADDHEGVCNVVAGVTEEGELAAAHVAELFACGHDVGKHLRGMELVGQAVPHGNAGVTGEILNNGLLEAAVLDAVEHAAENLRGVSEGFLLAHLGGTGIEEGDAHAEVACADFECAAGTGGGLFEEQNDLFIGQPLVLDAVILHALELGSEVKEIVDFVRG